MRFGRTRRFTVNFGNFESYSFGTEISFDHGDFGYSDEDVATLSEKERDRLWADIKEAVYAELEEEMKEEIADSQEITGNKKSFVLRSFYPRSK